MTENGGRRIGSPTTIRRSNDDWRSVRGFRTASLPWRLWERAKQQFWDPADLDFTNDRAQWQSMSEGQQLRLGGLARGFMIGEEAVTLDILPLLVAIADQGRTEEAMYLTTFAMEEAKHTDFFRRWFDAVGTDPGELLAAQRRRMAERGIEPPETNRDLFGEELPRIMRRVLADPSPQAMLDCGVTYNQFIEGVLALTGYKVYAEMFSSFGILPGLRRGLELVRRDESRHITYGTYLCRRILARNPELIDWARARMYELRDTTLGTPAYGAGAGRDGAGAGSADGDRAADRAGIANGDRAADGAGSVNGDRAADGAGSVNGDRAADGAGSVNGDRAADGAGAADGQRREGPDPFDEYAHAQVERRVQILERAVGLDPDQAELGEGAEQIERRLEEE